jgi:predicted nucleic acid-binding Zn ribbon protein
VSSPNRRRAPLRPREGESREGEELGSILDGMLGQRPWRSGMALGELARRWSDVVGDRLARECEPVGLENGALLVRASSSAWAAQIGFLAEEVRSRAEGVIGEGSVASVRVSVDAGPLDEGRRGRR